MYAYIGLGLPYFVVGTRAYCGFPTWAYIWTHKSTEVTGRFVICACKLVKPDNAELHVHWYRIITKQICGKHKIN